MMPPSKQTSKYNHRAPVSTSTAATKEKKSRKESVKAGASKSKLVEGIGLELSQSSSSTSDDGLAEALLQKLQLGLDKKQKEKETKCLAAYEKELTEIQTRSREEVKDCCVQIDEAYAAFILEHAKLEDHIRALWVRIAKTFEPYIDQINEQINEEEQAEKLREKEQMRGLAYHTKADEDFHQLISALLEDCNFLNK